MSHEMLPSGPPGADALILESLGVALMAVDEQCRLTRFNVLAEQLTGARRDTVLGRLCHEVLQASSCNDGCPLREALRSAETYRNGTVLLALPGRPAVTVEMTASALRGESGAVVGAVAIMRDVAADQGNMRVYGGRIFASRTQEMRTVFELLPRLKSSSAPLLIQGERGTGRMALAETLHQLGDRGTARPLVAGKCRDLSKTSLARVLAASAAIRAGSATLVLEDVCDASASLQRELRVWLDDEGPTANVRLISTATPRVVARVEEGTFREDLYFRLNVLHVDVPNLKQRREDIPLLAEQFVHELNSERKREVAGLSSDALQLLLGGEFPGNVRQLRSAIAEAHEACRGPIIEVDDLPRQYRRNEAATGSRRLASRRASQAEKEAIEEALARCGGSVARAAQELNMHRTTFWRKTKRYGIRR